MDIVSYILNKNSIGEIQDEVDQIEEDLVDINTELDKKVNKDELGSSAYLDAPAIGDAADNEVVLGCDSRLTDARTPVAHTHLMNEIADLPTLGTVVTYDIPVMGDALPDEVVMGDDTRLTDNRDPNPHNHVVADITDFPTLGTAAAKDYTSTYDPTSSDLVTGEVVGEAINSLPNPMVFKGSLGDGGTITQLPAPVAANEGFTYKVITEGTYAGVHAGIGDMFTCGDPDNDHIFEWVHFPSGDEPGGTVMSVKIQGSGAIAVDDESAITTSGVRTISHNDSGVTAGTYTSVTVDEKGHVTAGSNPDISYNDLIDKPTLGTAAALDVPASGNAGSGQVVKGDDSRLTDARTPVSHTHTLSEIIDAGTAAALDVPATGDASSTEVVLGSDTRLTDARTPVSHTHTTSEITDFPTLGTASALDVATTGDASSSQVVKGDDSRLTDARNAADVYSWAKASTKPSYTASEVGALADTTKYAGASTAGGAATSAEKLTNTSKIGDTNKPVYFSADGVPVAISYTIDKSVPSNAIFTDTNTTYTIATGDANGQIKVTPSSGSAYNVSVKGLGSNAYTSTSYLPLGGGTMTGQLKTSFKESVAMGSYAATSTTIPDLCNELRYSSGCCGSVNIGTKYTGSPSTINTGWYNFLWIPHRSGGVNGSASDDNCNYGRLILRGMTVNGEYEIRFNSGSIAYCRELISAANIGSQSVNYATSAGSATKATQDGSGNTITSTYLKLAGGTMTGNLTFSGSAGIQYTGTKATYGMIKFKDNTSDTYGNGIIIGGGGLTVIGAGESADTVAAQFAAGDENMHIAADSNVYIYSNVNNGYSSRKTFTFGTDGTLTATKFSGDISSGTGLTKSQVTTALGYTPPTSDTNTTYTLATGGSAGQIKVTPSSGSAYNVDVKSIVKHLGNAGKSNMNDVGKLFPSVGMTNLSDPSNTVDNPLNGTTKSTGWHLYWDVSYADDPSGTNSWVAQIANKAGTATWWVRSRDGGSITNGTAWKSGWEHLVISPQAGQGGTTTPIYIDANGHTQSCSYTIAKSVPSNAVFTDTNTWRGIQDNLTSSTNTTESLSAKQGYLLANGSARDSTKLPLAGGTMTGTIVTPGDDTKGLEPATNNYGRIGSSDKYYYQAFISQVTTGTLLRKNTSSDIGGTAAPFRYAYVSTVNENSGYSAINLTYLNTRFALFSATLSSSITVNTNYLLVSLSNAPSNYIILTYSIDMGSSQYTWYSNAVVREVYLNNNGINAIFSNNAVAGKKMRILLYKYA